jgi:hypothetical protein
MKTTLTLFAAFLFAISQAQPTITSNSLPPLGKESTFYISKGVKTFNPGASGASITWNFTTLDTTDGIYRERAIKPDTTTFYVNFPTTSNYRTSFIDIFGSIDYNYAILDTQKLETFGTVNEIYTNPKRLFNFPMAYNAQFSDVYHSGDSTFYGVNTVKADGYGQLQLPNGSYQNVMRVKTFDVYREITSRDFNGVPDDSLNFERTAYKWYAPNVKGPVLEYSQQISFYFVNNNRVYLDTFSHLYVTTTRVINGIANFEAEFSIYPNPVKDVLTIHSSEEIANIELYDLSGRVVKVSSINSTHGTIDFSALTTGMYQCKLIAPDNRFKYIKIIHQ